MLDLLALFVLYRTKHIVWYWTMGARARKFPRFLDVVSYMSTSVVEYGASVLDEYGSMEATCSWSLRVRSDDGVSTLPSEDR
jgi:hypothetical protein